MPLVITTPGARSAPDTHGTPLGIWCRCRFNQRGSIGSLMLTSGAWGSSANLSQQLPKLCLCASGSKQLGSLHQVHVLQGSLLKGPPRRLLMLTGRCAAQAASHACQLGWLWPMPHLTPSPS